MRAKKTPTRWLTNNKVKIGSSREHADTFIVYYPDGTFTSVQASAENMLHKYPVVRVICN